MLRRASPTPPVTSQSCCCGSSSSCNKRRTRQRPMLSPLPLQPSSVFNVPHSCSHLHLHPFQAALLWQQQQLQQEAYAAAADAEPSPERRRRELEAALDFVPPTGPQYMYNEGTGMLYTLGECGGVGGQHLCEELQVWPVA